MAIVGIAVLAVVDPDAWPVAVILGVFLLIGLVVCEWLWHAAVERNAAVLDGMDPSEVNRQLPAGGTMRALWWIGSWLFAYLLALGVLRALGVVVLAGARVLDVEPTVRREWSLVLGAVWLAVSFLLAWLLRKAVEERARERDEG